MRGFTVSHYQNVLLAGAAGGECGTPRQKQRQEGRDRDREIGISEDRSVYFHFISKALLADLLLTAATLCFN